MTPTPKLNLYRPEVSPPEVGWGAAVNGNFDILDDALVPLDGEITVDTQVAYSEGVLSVIENEIEWDLSTTPIARVVLDDDAELQNPTSPPDANFASVYMLKVIQDGEGGHELTFDTGFRFPGGVVPTNSQDPNSYDILTIYKDGSGNFNVLSAQNFLAED